MMFIFDRQIDYKKFSHFNTSILKHLKQLFQLNQHKQRMQTCSIHFIDCMGYFDLISQMINITFTIMILVKIIRIFIQLKNEHAMQSDQELRKSYIRKLTINGISIVYLTFLLFSIVFSSAIFIHYKQNFDEILTNKVNLWYKWSEILFINLLNCLNITVGFLYWKAVRAFFKISQAQMPIVFRAPLKGIFILLYVFNIAIIVVSLVLLLVTDQCYYQKYQIKIVNLLNAIGVSSSTFLCLACRILYQRYILSVIDVHKSAITKQKIYSIVIAFSSLCRFICVVLNLLGIDYSQDTRQFNQDCIDQGPYHALLMFAITICINLLPPLIFSMIFTTLQRKKKKHSQIRQYLVKHNSESIRYV